MSKLNDVLQELEAIGAVGVEADREPVRGLPDPPAPGVSPLAQSVRPEPPKDELLPQGQTALVELDSVVEQLTEMRNCFSKMSQQIGLLTASLDKLIETFEGAAVEEPNYGVALVPPEDIEQRMKRVREAIEGGDTPALSGRAEPAKAPPRSPLVKSEPPVGDVFPDDLDQGAIAVEIESSVPLQTQE